MTACRECGAPLPYGYRAVPDDGGVLRLAPDPEEQRTIELVRSLSYQRSLSEIVAELERLGVPPRGERWHRNTVQHILAMSHRGSGYVYFMRAACPFGPVKIGVSSDPWRRVEQVMSERRFWGRAVLLAYACGDEELEAALHAQFEDLRLPGTNEWFLPGRRLLAYIAAMEPRPREPPVVLHLQEEGAVLPAGPRPPRLTSAERAAIEQYIADGGGGMDEDLTEARRLWLGFPVEKLTPEVTVDTSDIPRGYYHPTEVTIRASLAGGSSWRDFDNDPQAQLARRIFAETLLHPPDRLAEILAGKLPGKATPLIAPQTGAVTVEHEGPDSPRARLSATLRDSGGG